MCAPLPHGDNDVFLSLRVYSTATTATALLQQHLLRTTRARARCRTRAPRFSLAPECVPHAKISTTSAPHHRRSTLTAHTLPRPPSPMTARASEDTPMRVADTRRCTPRQTITSRALGSNHQGNLIEMTERVYGPKQSPLELYHQRRL